LSPRRFVCVGGFDERKGVDILLRALDRLVGELEFELVMVGAPGEPLYGMLRKSLSPELWRRVVFKSQLRSADVAQELAEATAMICPTRADTGPMVVKEAVVAGVPVVGSAVGGIPDYIVPGKNGLLFAPGDVGACVQAIRDVCAHPLLGQGLVDLSTLQQKRDYLSPGTVARRFAGLYQRVRSEASAERKQCR
jgi:glycosyltransferase involved in cell wall biosynthesis